MAVRMVEEGLISSIEATELLGITLNNLRQIQHRKQLCYVSKQGRKVYYRRSDVEAYAQKRRDRHG